MAQVSMLGMYIKSGPATSFLQWALNCSIKANFNDRSMLKPVLLNLKDGFPLNLKFKYQRLNS